jgi:triacylglycerol esterase/lipase EstA (alpha/beta hydrolase family)
MPILLAVLVAVLVAAVAVSMIGCALFRYEAVAAPEATPPLSGRATAAVFAWGAAALAVAGLAYPLGFFRFLWRPRGQAPTARTEIVLLHGLYHNPSAWWLFAPALTASGLGRTHALAYTSFGGKSFADIARELTPQVHAILDRSPRIALVGHSMGGLLIRHLLADARIARATAAAVTIGAPHHGSKVAALALMGRVGRQLLPGSPLFPELAALPVPGGVPRLNIASPADDMVLPNASCAAPGDGWTAWESPPASHVALLYHPTVIRKTSEFLKTHAA